MFKKIKVQYQKVSKSVFYKTCTASAFLATAPVLSVFALDTKFGKTGVDVVTDTTDISDWPWTRFLNSLAEQLTGPLPLILGVLGLAVAAIGMFMGNHGAGMQKALVLVFAVSICLFAPSAINYIGQSAHDTKGITIFVPSAPSSNLDIGSSVPAGTIGG